MKHILKSSGKIGFAVLILSIFSPFSQSKEKPLQTFRGCTLVPMRGSDGDSFQVRFPDGRTPVVRLYAVDCIEAKIWDENDSRRLKEQRRYFGIANYKRSNTASIEIAKHFGEKAGKEVEKLLSRPFTVHTSFADGRGSGYHKRIYAFVTTGGGEDLGAYLVRNGLARAFGVCRSTPEGMDRDELRNRLEDLEIRAARLGVGVWAMTDWNSFSKERQAHRAEAAELKMAIDREKHTGIVDPNTAARDELMTLDGIGETIAVRIIENRPYRTAADLLKVKSIGPATLQRIQNRLPAQFRLPSQTSTTKSRTASLANR